MEKYIVKHVVENWLQSVIVTLTILCRMLKEENQPSIIVRSFAVSVICAKMIKN